MSKPLILVTNDDSIVAPGIRALIEVMKELGEVVVVAPDSPQSAMGHAITINNTLKLEKVHLDKELEQEYSCSGTPVDCVKIAVNENTTKDSWGFALIRFGNAIINIANQITI